MRTLRYGLQHLQLPAKAGELPWLSAEEPAPLTDLAAALRGVLAKPVSGPPLVAHLAGRRRVGVVLPDGTRPLPPFLVETLLEQLGGLEHVVVRIANGTHRQTTAEEQRALLGRFAGQVEVGDRAADDPADHALLAGGPDAPPFRSIDAVAAGCDALVLMGPMAFHYLAGFGGGGKLIAPGLADRATASWVHQACLAPSGGRDPRAQAGRIDGNPLRERLESVCRCAPPQFYVIPVLDSLSRPVAVFAGDRAGAVAAASGWLRSRYGVPCRRFRTVVACAGGAPYDHDFVQAHKAWEMAQQALLPGGTVVWVAQCREGLPPRHLAFLERHPTAAQMEAALRERFDIAAHTVWAARLKAERSRVVAVTDLPASVVGALGMEKVESLEAALASVSLEDAAVLPLGARFLPLAEE